MSMNQVAIKVENVSKQFKLLHNGAYTLKKRVLGIFYKRHRQKTEIFNALKDVSFTLHKGQSLALLGHNGSGKSTLMQLIAGILQPSQGRLVTEGRVAPLIELGVGFHPDLTGIENIFLNASLYGFSNRKIRSRLADIIAFSELEHFIDTPVKHYSSGMYMRLGFSVAIHMEPNILLADEILSVGDQAFQEKCHQRILAMQKQGMTLVLVTHASEMAKTFCDYYLKLDQGKVVEFGETINL